MTKSFESFNRYMEISNNIYEKMWDMWMMSMGSFSWTQDQVSDYYKSFLDRMQLASAENAKTSEDLLKQVKDSQTQMRSIFEESVNTTFSNIQQMPVYDYFSQLNQKISDLSSKVDKD